MLKTAEGDSGPEYILLNTGTAPAMVEFKVWFELSGRAVVPLFTAGADSSMVLPAGSQMTFYPLAQVRMPADSYILRARVLDTASGALLYEK